LTQTHQELSKAALLKFLIVLQIQQIVDRLQEKTPVKLHVDGLIGSAISIVIHSLKKPNILLIVLNNKEEATSMTLSN
jgi:transcription-repair coupling factor (superfamily II helicase)